MPRRAFSDWMFVMVHPSFSSAHGAHPPSIRKSARIDETLGEDERADFEQNLQGRGRERGRSNRLESS